MDTKNARAKIRTDKQRIESIKLQRAKLEAAEAAEGGVLVEEMQPSEWRPSVWVRITFPEFPGRDVINELKAAGFFWSKPSWVGQKDKMPEGIVE